MSKIRITTSFNLNSDDQKVLSLLYLPIIGPDSFSLYFLLHNLIDKTSLESNNFNKEELLSLLGFKITKFNKSLANLEAIGLVRTFVKDDDFLIMLLSPFTAKNFLKDTVLGLYLEDKVGKDIFLKEVELFKIPELDLSIYKEITKNFDEVYKELGINHKKITDNIEGKRPNHELPSFDLELFLSKIDISKFKDGIDDEIRKQFEIAYSTFHYTLEQMTNLFYDSLDKDGYFKIDLFKKNSIRLYEFLKKDDNKTVDSRISDFDNMNAIELLDSIYKDGYPSILIQKVNDIYTKINLPKGVINLMILYVYNLKGDILSPSYYEKMSISWEKSGITDTESALAYIRKKNTKKTTTNSKQKKDIELEDWQIEGMKEIMEGFKINE